MNNLFDIKNVSFSYTSEKIIDDISFKIKKGDFIGLVGANGSGKTTLIKLLLGQLKPTQGRIIKKEGLKTGYVEQVTISSDNSFPATVMEIVLLGLYKKIGLFKFATAQHKKTALAAIKEMGLSGLENVQINKLSGGQQQKVLIAKTFVEDSDILLLDEPATGIDQQSQQEFYKILEHLNKRHNKTIIIVTHSIDKVLNTTRILKLENKKIEEKNVKI